MSIRSKKSKRSPERLPCLEEAAERLRGFKSRFAQLSPAEQAKFVAAARRTSEVSGRDAVRRSSGRGR